MATMALEPAPIQLHYLGYPCTSGSTFVHYLVADAVVTPPELTQYYSEKIVFFPETFQVCSHKQEHPRTPESQNLHPQYPWADKPMNEMPLTGPILCNSNQMFKLHPELFEVWLRILQKSPNATLMLVLSPKEAEKHVRKRLRKMKIPSYRVQFMPKLDLWRHLRRLAACDVFLDNTEYNSGTTAGDVFWAEVPIVSYPGEKHSARHVASMAKAMGVIGALTPRSVRDYEKLVLNLINKPEITAQIKRRIEATRPVSPLFDTQRWVMHWEMGLRGLWEIFTAQGKIRSHMIINQGKPPVPVTQPTKVQQLPYAGDQYQQPPQQQYQQYQQPPQQQYQQYQQPPQQQQQYQQPPQQQQYQQYQQPPQQQHQQQQQQQPYQQYQQPPQQQQQYQHYRL
jgi:predicted O-linked N-acetylglucosamine transferase (SPINDLY family)